MLGKYLIYLWFGQYLNLTAMALSKVQYQRIYAADRIFELVLRGYLVHRRDSPRVERHLPVHYSVRRVQTNCKALGPSVERILLEC